MLTNFGNQRRSLPRCPIRGIASLLVAMGIAACADGVAPGGTPTPPPAPNPGPFTWGLRELGGSYSAVACATANECVAVGSGGAIRRWNGTEWMAVASTDTTGLQGVTCPSAGTCFVVGNGFATQARTNGIVSTIQRVTSNGATNLYAQFMPWMPAQIKQLAAIGCLTTTDCLVVGDSGEIKHYDGTRWVARPSAVRTRLTAISCVANTSCTAVGDLGVIQRWDRTTWTIESSGTGATLRDVDCPSATSCLATGDSGTVLRWDGSVWSRQETRATTVGRVSCASPTDCTVLESGGLLRWNGTGWSRTAASPPLGLGDLACPAGAACVATASPSAIMRWGAASWTVEWQGIGDLLGVSCGGAANCVAVGSSGTTIHWDGADWAARPSGNSETLNAVACPAASDCVAVGNAGTIRRWNGTAWSGQASGTTARLSVVSCATTNFCVAAGDSGTVQRWDGVAWSSFRTGLAPDHKGNASGLSCTASSHCVMTTGNWGSFRWDGTAWAAMQATNGNQPNGGVTCLTATSCVASSVGYPGMPYQGPEGAGMYVWTGSMWQRSFAWYAGDLRGIACRATLDCLVAGALGDIRANADSTWPSRSTNARQGLRAVAFASPRLAFAVGPSGTIVTGTR